MDFEKFERDIKAKYKRTRSHDITKRVSSLLEHIDEEWGIPATSLNIHELKALTNTVIGHESSALHEEVEKPTNCTGKNAKSSRQSKPP